MHPFKKMIFKLYSINNFPKVSSLTGNAFLNTSTYSININLILDKIIDIDTVFQIQVDSGMLSYITVLAGNDLGSDNIDTGSSSYGSGMVPVCILSCDNPNIDTSTFTCETNY